MSDGRFVWYELMTSDVEAGKAFYTEVIGWKTIKWDEGDYTMFAVGERGVGGVMKLPEEAKAMGAPPHWLAYVATADVDATVAKANELGAKTLVPPMDIPNVGRFSVLADPQGAVFAAFRGINEMPEHATEAGDFSWSELATTDYEAGFSFYQQLFGWTAGDSMDSPAGKYQMFKLGEKTLGGVYNKPAEMPAPPHWLYYITVEDLAAAIDRVTRLGGQIVMGPMDVPGGDMIAGCIDPQGAAFALHSSAKKA